MGMYLRSSRSVFYQEKLEQSSKDNDVLGELLLDV